MRSRKKGKLNLKLLDNRQLLSTGFTIKYPTSDVGIDLSKTSKYLSFEYFLKNSVLN